MVDLAEETKRLADAQEKANALKERELNERHPQQVIRVRCSDTAYRPNSLQSISDWWHGGSGQGARSRHMRVRY